MTKRIDGLISEWAEDVVNRCGGVIGKGHDEGFSGINIIEKILRDPGISTAGSRHAVHWWPRNYRISMMSRAMHKIDTISQVCLLVRYGRILKDDGNVYTKHDLAKDSSIEVRRFNDLVKKARIKLLEITRAY